MANESFDESMILSEELCEELDRRVAIEDANPDDEFTWEEVKAGVPRRNTKSSQ